MTSSETHVTCRACYEAGKAEEGEILLHLDLDEATCDRDGDHLTFYHVAECETCGEEISVVEYGKIHSLEVE